LPRISHDDAVERGNQTEQAEPDKHVQPAARIADTAFHRLRQGIVDIGDFGPVA
jgi:hypothetical protein